MKIIAYLMCAVSLLIANPATGHTQEFKTSTIESGWLLEEYRVDYLIDDLTVGFIYYVKTPFNAYIIHSFYIHPKFRHQGLGKNLLIYLCTALKEQKARLVFIQPGPFEIDKTVEPDAYNIKLYKLIRLYKSLGFEFAPSILLLATYLPYKIMGLKEDPRYLMVKKD